MAVHLQRGVDFPMVDLANIAYYPRIFDLAHRFFEDSWLTYVAFAMQIYCLNKKSVFQLFMLNRTSMHRYAMGM